MTHDTTLIATIAAGLGLAFVLGLAFSRFRLPPVAGYLVAGVLVGPFTPGFVADASLASQLAELGVILLMFGVGLHFSVRDLIAARRVAVPGALVQIVIAAALGALVARFWGWPWPAAAVFGLSLSVASTVVITRTFEQRGMLDSADGRLAVGWLVVEDLAMVGVLVVLPALVAPGAGGGSGSLAASLALTAFKVAAFVGLMLVLGRRFVPWLLTHVARTGSRELFTLGVLAIALGIAVGAAKFFGVSFALGAFLGGMVISESELSHQAAADALPLQDAFAVLFFVSVGMLFEPSILVREPLRVLAVLVVIVVGQGAAALALALALGRPLRSALVLGAAVSQVGEFSFIVAALGVGLGVLPREGQGLILAGALLSITLNPLLFGAIGPIEAWITARPAFLARLERLNMFGGVPMRDATAEHVAALTGHVVIVGYGRVGSAVGEVLAGERIPFVAIERDLELVERLRARGVQSIFGDAARPGILEHARVSHARLVVVTAPEPFHARQVIDRAKLLNPTIDSVVRTHNEEELEWLQRAGVGRALMGERELAFAMARYALQSVRHNL